MWLRCYIQYLLVCVERKIQRHGWLFACVCALFILYFSMSEGRHQVSLYNSQSSQSVRLPNTTYHIPSIWFVDRQKKPKKRSKHKVTKQARQSEWWIISLPSSSSSSSFCLHQRDTTAAGRLIITKNLTRNTLPRTYNQCFLIFTLLSLKNRQQATKESKAKKASIDFRSHTHTRTHARTTPPPRKNTQTYLPIRSTSKYYLSCTTCPNKHILLLW